MWSIDYTVLVYMKNVCMFTVMRYILLCFQLILPSFCKKEKKNKQQRICGMFYFKLILHSFKVYAIYAASVVRRN